MHRYYLLFTKKGNIKYISHLDLLRLFKRGFKRVGVGLVHSQGFNPHPKMGFAQPLSLGYQGLSEVLEFETYEPINPEELGGRLSALMPEGIDILSCGILKQEGKSLAAATDSALYQIIIPTNMIPSGFSMKEFLLQESLMVEKRNKKKEMVSLDIRQMIRSLEMTIEEEQVEILATLDAGSNSNLSPEHLLQAIQHYTGVPIDRERVEIARLKIYYVNNYQL